MVDSPIRVRALIWLLYKSPYFIGFIIFFFCMKIINYFQPFENSVRGGKFATFLRGQTSLVTSFVCTVAQQNTAEKGKKRVPGKFCIVGGPGKYSVLGSPSSRRPVSSVGRASDYCAGGLGFETQAGPTLRVLK